MSVYETRYYSDGEVRLRNVLDISAAASLISRSSRKNGVAFAKSLREQSRPSNCDIL